MWEAYSNQVAERRKRAEAVFNQDLVTASHVTDINSFWKLEKLTIKELKIWWDTISLEKFISKGMIPRGLRIRKYPAYEIKDDVLLKKWNDTLTNCLLKLMQLLDSGEQECDTVGVSARFINQRMGRNSDFYPGLYELVVRRLDSYLKDTRDVLRLLDDLEWNSTYGWGKADVTSLYSSIPREKGMLAIDYHLNRYSNYLDGVKSFIMEANAYNCILSLQRRPSVRGEKLFEEFVGSLNNEALNLRFTSCYDRKNIAYLDLWISIEGRIIVTRVYTKTFTGNSLLRGDSRHPQHFNGGIPRGQFLRLRRNCNTVEKFVEQSFKLQDKFLHKGYDLKDLRNAFKLALDSGRTELIKGRQKKENKKERNLINKHLPILYGDKVFKQLLEPGIQVLARRAPTPGMTLAPSMFNKEPRFKTWLDNLGMFRCGSTRNSTLGIPSGI
ncbi:hypothetical protein XELAEV_18034894mg [Xenopus laevis]|uniref:Helix-turn-helix domain-containing protein n=1 Tax=Xenopus laevis TaxID=8355 RepID=A0A974CEQ3_XENLA|nr:hypothetical protein XELAEV_18034894mg [Xenopus laevis]